MRGLTLLNSKDCRLKAAFHEEKHSPSIQRLLGVIASLLAEEYIQTARQNQDLFHNKGAIK